MTAIQLEDLLVTTKHLNQIELSRRWSISPRTLERWRWLRQGPRYLKIGGRILYRLDDVEAYEASQVHAPRAKPAGTPVAASRA
jgi:Helix-turn-helix domain